MPAKKVRYTQPLLGEDTAAGYLIAVPGASVLIRQDGVECDVFSDNDGTAMTNPVPTAVPVGTAGVDVRGTLLVYLDPGSGYDAVATVGVEASTFAIPDVSPAVEDVVDPTTVTTALATKADAAATTAALATKADSADAAMRAALGALAVAAVKTDGNLAALSGTPIIDGYQTVAGDIVVLTAQTTGSQNGPWTVAAGAWTRPPDYATGQTVLAGRMVKVANGTVHAGQAWTLTTANVTVGPTAQTWTQSSVVPPVVAQVFQTTADYPDAVAQGFQNTKETIRLPRRGSISGVEYDGSVRYIIGRGSVGGAGGGQAGQTFLYFGDPRDTFAQVRCGVLDIMSGALVDFQYAGNIEALISPRLSQSYPSANATNGVLAFGTTNPAVMAIAPEAATLGVGVATKDGTTGVLKDRIWVNNAASVANTKVRITDATLQADRTSPAQTAFQVMIGASLTNTGVGAAGPVLNNPEAHPRFRLLASGALQAGDGTADPVANTFQCDPAAPKYGWYSNRGLAASVGANTGIAFYDDGAGHLDRVAGAAVQLYLNGWYGIAIDGHIAPQSDAARDLGDPAARWRDMYLGRHANIGGAIKHTGTTAGFYGTTPIAKQTGVPVSAAGVHAALVALGLIAA